MEKIKRCCAMYIDYFIICAICYIPLQILFRNQFGFPNQSMNIYMFSVVILVIIKDITFKNYSIGKKILKLKIQTESNNVPKLSSIILRNVFLILWPIELILVLTTNRRIGDRVFKTKVVEQVIKII